MSRRAEENKVAALTVSKNYFLNNFSSANQSIVPQLDSSNRVTQIVQIELLRKLHFSHSLITLN